ncbi:unnamed protein product [Danaus chrysippus]|uniref:(African queen) hypothetical protein n=1 Tax=Danaus chrysippus TaxID=151541 RepID=A0A8J2R275_9NEOP|nr:unnamed protein product [Danaus chrysippus]
MRLTGLFNISILCVIVFGYQNNEEKVLLIAPVLAANKNPRARVIETAKDFPIVRLLSIDNSTKVFDTHKGFAEPIYVEQYDDNYYVPISTSARQRYYSGLGTYPAQSSDQTVIVVPNGGKDN